jgi:hypothetical protein
MLSISKTPGPAPSVHLRLQRGLRRSTPASFPDGRMGAMSDIVFRAIGVIHSPFKQQKGTPIQSALAGDAAG